MLNYTIRILFEKSHVTTEPSDDRDYEKCQSNPFQRRFTDILTTELVRYINGHGHGEPAPPKRYDFLKYLYSSLTTA